MAFTVVDTDAAPSTTGAGIPIALTVSASADYLLVACEAAGAATIIFDSDHTMDLLGAYSGFNYMSLHGLSAAQGLDAGSRGIAPSVNATLYYVTVNGAYQSTDAASRLLDSSGYYSTNDVFTFHMMSPDGDGFGFGCAYRENLAGSGLGGDAETIWSNVDISGTMAGYYAIQVDTDAYGSFGRAASDGRGQYNFITLAPKSATVQGVSGTLILNGIVAILKKAFLYLAGTIPFSGGPSTMFKSFLKFAGTLVMSASLNASKIFRQIVAGLIGFSSQIQRTVFYDRVVSGVLVLSGGFRSHLRKFVKAFINLCLSPIAVIRTWLAPTADVDMD